MTPREFSRRDRLAQQIHRELALLIQTEISDPRTGFLTVTSVKLSHDHSHAKIVVSFLKPAVSEIDALIFMNESVTLLRSLLSKKIHFRLIPQLLFVLDTQIKTAVHLGTLIREADRRLPKGHKKK